MAERGTWWYATTANAFTRVGAVPKRQTLPDLTPQTSAVVDEASMLFAVELAGSLYTEKQFDILCERFNLSTLEAFGINGTLFHNTLCENRGAKAIPIPPIDTSNAVATLSSRIWILQALGAFEGNYQAACNAFSVDGASATALNGTLAKQVLCDAAVGNVTNFPQYHYPPLEGNGQ